jgi:cupin 2 domain-containing protein
MDQDLTVDIPRVVQILAGVLMLLTAIALSVATVALWSALTEAEGSPPPRWTLPLFAMCAMGCWLLTWRLISNRRRSDGGLLSPLFLRLASLIFVAGGALTALENPFNFEDYFSMFGAAFACFVVARMREKKANQSVEKAEEESGDAVRTVAERPDHSAAQRRASLFDAIPEDLSEEAFTELLQGENFRLERIVSRGHSSPETDWYDQQQHEWVMVLKGEAKITFEDNRTEHLVAGSYINIPASTRHKVTWTTPDSETIWLAIHYT